MSQKPDMNSDLVSLCKEISRRDGKLDFDTNFSEAETLLKNIVKLEADKFRIAVSGAANLEKDLQILFREIPKRMTISADRVQSLLHTLVDLENEEKSFGGRSPSALIRALAGELPGPAVVPPAMRRGLGPSFMLSRWAKSLPAPYKEPIPKIQDLQRTIKE